MKYLLIIFLLPLFCSAQIKKHPARPVVYSAGAAITYATWNPSDKDAAITLSSGNLAVATSATFKCCRGNIGKSSGKWYWEVKYVAGGGGLYGIANLSADVTNAFDFGANTNSWGLISVNSTSVTTEAHNATYPSVYSFAMVTNDVISFALDMGAGTLDIKINNTLVKTYTGITGTVYPYIGYWDYSSSTFITNFGASAFTYTPPSGYTGLY